MAKHSNLSKRDNMSSESVGQPAPDIGYLRTPEAAKYLGVSVSWLEQGRCRGDGPKYFKPPGAKLVLYRRADLAAWVEAGARRSTSECAA